MGDAICVFCLCWFQSSCREFQALRRISGVPNAVERLDREGLKVIQTTAGKWKRTIDPFQAPTPEALAKAEEDRSDRTGG